MTQFGFATRTGTAGSTELAYTAATTSTADLRFQFGNDVN